MNVTSNDEIYIPAVVLATHMGLDRLSLDLLCSLMQTSKEWKTYVEPYLEAAVTCTFERYDYIHRHRYRSPISKNTWFFHLPSLAKLLSLYEDLHTDFAAHADAFYESGLKLEIFQEGLFQRRSLRLRDVTEAIKVLIDTYNRYNRDKNENTGSRIIVIHTVKLIYQLFNHIMHSRVNIQLSRMVLRTFRYNAESNIRHLNDKIRTDADARFSKMKFDVTELLQDVVRSCDKRLEVDYGRLDF